MRQRSFLGTEWVPSPPAMAGSAGDDSYLESG